MNPVFVKLRNDQGRLYDSYTDFWRLVELSGFPTCELDQVDRFPGGAVGEGGGAPPVTYIFSPPNGNAAAHASCPRSPACRFVCWQLERPGRTPDGQIDWAGYLPRGYDQVWLSDRWAAGKLREVARGLTPAVRFVPMGGHPGLGLSAFSIQHSALPKRWDATHQSYAYGRRQRILHDLARAGLGIGDACWGRERDEQLANSRIGLCIHQDDPPVPMLEPLRYTLFACWGLPIVADHCEDFYPYAVASLVTCHWSLVSDPNDTASHNWHRLTQDLTFRRCVEDALAD